MSTIPALLDALTEQLGPAAVVREAEALAPYLVEWRGRYQGRTPALVAPATAAEVAHVVQACRAAGVAITLQGGNTGLVGGQIPDGEILLSTKRLRTIRAVSADDDSLIAEAGVTLAEVQNAATGAGRRFPLSLASQGSATIGGLIAANAGGVHVVRHGMMRAHVLGLEVVLADGRVWNGLSTLRKDNTGYDLKQLFIGAEGTLGVITAAALKLSPAPGQTLTAMAALQTPDQALELFHTLREGAGLAAFELMSRRAVAMAIANVPGLKEPFAVAPPYAALIEIEADEGAEAAEALEARLNAALERGLIFDAALARSHAQAEAMWRLRESLPAGHRTGAPQANHDISVPVAATPRFLEQAGPRAEAVCPGAQILAFGHMGDGNIHLTVLAPAGMSADAFPREAVSAAIHTLALELGGSISAEHGIGVARRAEFERAKDPLALELMARTKAMLDPTGLFNPRVLVSPWPKA